MATTKELKIDNKFADGDNRLITLKNPKETITTTEITALNALIAGGNLIIGDKEGAAFSHIGTVTKVTKEITEITF